MSGLFGMLSTTARSLDAQRYGLDAAGQNIANVNTPGYSRRVVDFGAVPPTSERLNAGNGVDVLGVRRLRDRFFDRRLFQENPAQHRESALAEALGIVESSLGSPDAHAERAAEPVLRRLRARSPRRRRRAPRAPTCWPGARPLAGEIRATDGRFQQAQLDTDRRVRSSVDEINSLANRLASLNERIANADASGTMTLRDEQNEVVRELSSLRRHRDHRSAERHRAGLVRPRQAAGHRRRRLRGDDPERADHRLRPALQRRHRRHRRRSAAARWPG